MTTYRNWSVVSGAWVTPTYAYDNTLGDTTTSADKLNSKSSEPGQVWKCATSVSGLTTVDFKIIRTYETQALPGDPDDVSSKVHLYYSWGGASWVSLSSIGDIGSDYTKADFTVETFSINTMGKNLNQLYIKADARGAYTGLHTWAVASQSIFDMYLDDAGATPGASTSVLTLNSAVSAGTTEFTTVNGKNGYWYSIPIKVDYTSNTNFGHTRIRSNNVVLYEYPVVGEPSITFTGTGTYTEDIRVVLTGPADLKITCVDSNELSVPVTHADWSNVAPVVVSNIYNTPMTLYSLDGVNNTGSTYSQQYSNMKYYPLMPSAYCLNSGGVSGATAGTATNPIQTTNSAGFFTGITDGGAPLHIYWPTTGATGTTGSTGTSGITAAFDEHDAGTPYAPTIPLVLGSEVDSFSTFMSSQSNADGSTATHGSQTVDVISDYDYTFTEAALVATNPTIKIVWEAEATAESSGDIITFDEGFIENYPFTYTSSSSVELEYSTDSGSTWGFIDSLFSDPAEQPAGTYIENQVKTTSVKAITGAITIANVKVRIRQQSNGRGVFSWTGSWSNIAPLDASTTVKVYGIYLEAATVA